MEEKLIPLFEEQNPGVKVEGSYDSSGKLQTQIEEGMGSRSFLFRSNQTDECTDGRGIYKGRQRKEASGKQDRSHCSKGFRSGDKQL